jgi:hypothetical protein
MLVVPVVVLGAVGLLLWRWRPRRPQGPGFRFVYINQDGSAREVSPEERDYLSQEFHGSDGGRPYIKSSYESRDGWGSRSGFLERRRVPARLEILPVNPDYDAAVKELSEDAMEVHRVAGDIIELNAEGSIVCTPNPHLSRKARFELIREHRLAQDRRYEDLARFPA